MHQEGEKLDVPIIPTKHEKTSLGYANDKLVVVDIDTIKSVLMCTVAVVNTNRPHLIFFTLAVCQCQILVIMSATTTRLLSQCELVN